MAKSEHNVISGNHLLGGHVVYWTADQSWSDALADALVLAPKDAADQLAVAGTTQSVAVGAEVCPVSLDGGAIRPITRRDAIKLNGPSPQVLTHVPSFAATAIAAE